MVRGVLLGPPGAGKGTQAQRVSERLGVAHLSTGDLLRSAVAEGTPAGRQAKEHMEAGRLVPDEVVFGVLFDRLAEEQGGYLLDGFPRNRAQAEELDRRLAGAQTPLDRVVDINVPDALVVDRITGRRSCGECGFVHHMTFMPPKAEGACDRCGGGLVQRKDDTAEVVGERLAVYREQTEPLIAYYTDQGLLDAVDGAAPVETVTESLLAALGQGAAEGC